MYLLDGLGIALAILQKVKLYFFTIRRKNLR